MVFLLFVLSSWTTTTNSIAIVLFVILCMDDSGNENRSPSPKMRSGPGMDTEQSKQERTAVASSVAAGDEPTIPWFDKNSFSMRTMASLWKERVIVDTLDHPVSESMEVMAIKRTGRKSD